MQTTTLLRAGDVIGGFRIDDVIGIGGMAIVYRAEQISLKRPVALKVLSSKLTSDLVFRERFRREGTHAAGLEHPNIVPVYDSGEQDGNLYIAMRLIEGTNLAELIETRGLTADQAIELLQPIASALDTAHAAGLIHRDIKPQNILISPHAHPYLADFGVAKGSNTEGLTATGGFIGSIHYASPEQIRGLTLTSASDVYALTAVFYQCLTGHVPFPRETDAGVMHAHLHDPPPTLPTTTGADSDFHTVLARGMAKDPGARYGHAGDLMTAAAVCVGRLPTDLRKAVPPFPAPSDCESDGGASARAINEGGGTEIITAADVAKSRAADHGTVADRWREPASPEAATPEPSRRSRLRRAKRGRAPAAVPVVAAPGHAPTPPETTTHSGSHVGTPTLEALDGAQRSSPSHAPSPYIGTRPSWRAIVAVVVVLLAAVTILAIVLASGTGGASHRYQAGNLAISLPPAWRPARTASGVAGFAHSSTFADGVNRIEIGSLGPTAALAAQAPAAAVRLYGRPSSEATVNLPLGPARRYEWGRGSDSRLLRMLVIASSAGELGLACSPPSPQDAAVCLPPERSLRLLAASVETPDGDTALASLLRRALGPRQTTRVTVPASRRLASLAGALLVAAKTSEDAASLISSLRGVPARYRADITSLSNTLAREGRLAGSLASAASTGQVAKYSALSLRFTETQRALFAAVEQLSARGVPLGNFNTIAIPAVPHNLSPRPSHNGGSRPGLERAARIANSPTTTTSAPPAQPSSPSESSAPYSSSRHGNTVEATGAL